MGSRRAEGAGGRPEWTAGPARPERPGGGRTDRPRRVDQVEDPPLPDDVEPRQLDRAARAPLRSLAKEAADLVARHLVMAGRLLEADPEAAYQHAQAAVRRGGRIDVVRETAGLAAYRTGRYAEALRELRTARRLNGSSEHLAVLADCERGLGRPERAVALAVTAEAAQLDPTARVELAIVLSGARLDLGEPDAALAALATPEVRAARGVLGTRVALARAAVLEAAGRPGDAAAERARFSAAQIAAAGGDEDDDEDDVVVVFDTTEDEGEDVGGPDVGEDVGGPDEGRSGEDTAARSASDDDGTDGAGRQAGRLGTQAVATGAGSYPAAAEDR